jgi:transcription termination factor Rho
MTDSNALVEGTFEAERDGGGRLRFAQFHYQVRPDDPLVPAALARKLHLKGGESISGTCRGPQGRGRQARVVEDVQQINGFDPSAHLDVKPFEDRTAIDPRKPIRFETQGGPMTMRVVDLFTPVGFGQRALIVAPPRTGKTVLLQQMADAVAHNHPDAYMIVLLIDERPEEVTDMRRKVHGEVIASSNDHDIASHVRVARLVISRARRLAEAGHDVVVLLDSLTRLGRAFNAAIKGGGRIMSGGLDIRALTEPKGIFGAARNIEDGGSLTIIASALIETGSRMDEVIFNEFKGTGNMELMLCRELANRRIWPAIDIDPSGTRKEELLLSPKAIEVAHAIRRKLTGRGTVQSMETLLEVMGKHDSNQAFIENFDPRRF